MHDMKSYSVFCFFFSAGEEGKRNEMLVKPYF